MTKAWVFGATSLFIVLIFALGYYLATNSGAASSPDSLSLGLSIGGPPIRQGGNITLIVSEDNPLSTPNNVPVANNWRVPDLLTGPCSPYAIGSFAPVDYAIVPGFYTESNISMASSNQITAGCGLSSSAIRSYDFQPSSIVASIIGECGGGACPTRPMSWSIIVNGYTNKVGEHVNFQTGTYTVIAADEWGHIVVSNFVVTG